MRTTSRNSFRKSYQALNWLSALVVSLLFVQPSFAQTSDLSHWKTFGATTDIRKIVEVDGEAWALTAGGIVRVDASNGSVSLLTNTDGLWANDFVDLMRDQNDNLWIGAQGWLVRRSALDFSYSAFAFLNENNSPLIINALADDGDLLWLAEERGLSLFSKTIDDGQFLDSYQRFGSYPAKTATIALELTTDSIWVLTQFGLAVAERISANQLKSFANWRSLPMDNFPELVGESPRSLIQFNGALVIGTNSDAYTLSYDALDTTFTSLGLPLATSVNAFEEFGSVLRLYTSRGVFEFDGTSLSAVAINGLPNSLLSSGKQVGGRWFIGVTGNGLYSSVSVTFKAVQVGTIPGGTVRDLTVTPGGRIIGAFDRDGFAVYDGTSWSEIQLSPSAWAIATTVDSVGAYWLGTFGGGLWRLTANDTIKYDSLNSTLRGNNDGGFNNFVVVPEIKASPFHLYATCFRAWDDNPISLIDQRDPNNWASFGTEEGVNNEFITSIDVYQNRIVVSSEARGVYFVDPGINPLIMADYQVTHFSEEKTERRFRLPSNAVNVVRFDLAGAVWAGHRFGLARFDLGIEWFIEVRLPLDLGPEVRDLLFDPQGNLWIATATGLGLFDRATESFERFTALNSGLVSNQINSLAFDPAENYLWIGTDKGISRFHPNLGQANFAPDLATAYPNPYVITSGNERLLFNFSGIADVNIFNEVGERVWAGDSVAGWDGRNQSGVAVASGVYIFTLSVDDSEVGVGKFLLIRNR